MLYFSFGRKQHFIAACAVKLYVILKVKNALAVCVHCVMHHNVCTFVLSSVYVLATAVSLLKTLGAKNKKTKKNRNLPSQHEMPPKTRLRVPSQGHSHTSNRSLNFLIIVTHVLSNLFFLYIRMRAELLQLRSPPLAKFQYKLEVRTAINL
jgi:hypothetical protein